MALLTWPRLDACGVQPLDPVVQGGPIRDGEAQVVEAAATVAECSRLGQPRWLTKVTSSPSRVSVAFRGPR
ncbi:hypothetical protein [Micropruina sp.]|uniref:hypothetical protein n=1 Tax=Micropruina sp. TaxID=2737536 RepID=UPI0039E5BBCF